MEPATIIPDAGSGLIVEENSAECLRVSTMTLSPWVGRFGFAAMGAELLYGVGQPFRHLLAGAWTQILPEMVQTAFFCALLSLFLFGYMADGNVTRS